VLVLLCKLLLVTHNLRVRIARIGMWHFALRLGVFELGCQNLGLLATSKTITKGRGKGEIEIEL